MTCEVDCALKKKKKKTALKKQLISRTYLHTPTYLLLTVSDHGLRKYLLHEKTDRRESGGGRCWEWGEGGARRWMWITCLSLLTYPSHWASPAHSGCKQCYPYSSPRHDRWAACPPTCSSCFTDRRPRWEGHGTPELTRHTSWLSSPSAAKTVGSGRNDWSLTYV